MRRTDHHSKYSLKGTKMLIMQGKFADDHGYTFPLIGSDWRKLTLEAYSLLPDSAPKYEGIAYWESAACDGDFPGAPARPEYGRELAVEIGRLTLGCDDVEVVERDYWITSSMMDPTMWIIDADDDRRGIVRAVPGVRDGVKVTRFVVNGEEGEVFLSFVEAADYAIREF